MNQNKKDFLPYKVSVSTMCYSEENLTDTEAESYLGNQRVGQ